jgi:hypothetical protein
VCRSWSGSPSRSESALCLRSERESRPRCLPRWLLPMILLAASSVAVRSEPVASLFNFLTTSVLVVALAFAWIDSSWQRWRVVNWMKASIRLIVSFAGLAVSMADQSRPKRARASSIVRSSVPLVWGLAPAMVVLILIGLLFSAADAVFADTSGDIGISAGACQFRGANRAKAVGLRLTR